MSQTTHTPGPWTAQQVDGQSIFNWHIGDGDHKSIASVCAWPDNKLGIITQAEADANARLIAAAPDMLAALEEVLSEWRHTMAKTESCDISDRQDEIEARAVAAITRAKGGA